MDHEDLPVSSLTCIPNCDHDLNNEFPEPSKIILESCSFQNWYSAFESYTFKSTIIPLASEVVRYLVDDLNGFFLPVDGDEHQYQSQLSDSEDSASSSDDEPDCRQANSRQTRPKYTFPELNQLIRNAIRLYDGSVFPKLNWSAPQDAAFMLPSGDGLLRCRCPNDIYTLLKTSDCIAHDLNLVRKEYPCTLEDAPSSHETHSNLPLSQFPIVLVLREWFNLNPAHEFRCFVRHRKLIAISARSSTFFDFLQSPDVQAAITTRISSFFQSVVAPNFNLTDFSFDVYLNNPTKTTSTSGTLRPNLKLLDFNPLSSYSDPYLFTFSELLLPRDQMNQKPELRLAPDSGPQPNTFASSRLPLDILSCSQGQDLANLTKQWTKLLAGGCVPNGSDSSESQDEG
ncbi:hypothetical protein CROQUDRAFT_62043 [Cronartium quercuum f. sp. fusiforme G11]|uniref:Cell division cycle protein 123 n=1 Tax=Cronartium quercuum f. sp. fusiforme G11 TaxID=708437 RepID=A0A9P6NHN5_9BASI|nr:hypothetical protein CROQUDRAFT_62043 [Cronartium quercuum f. sp. fusiforme G11]